MLLVCQRSTFATARRDLAAGRWNNLPWSWPEGWETGAGASIVSIAGTASLNLSKYQHMILATAQPPPQLAPILSAVGVAETNLADAFLVATRRLNDAIVTGQQPDDYSHRHGTLISPGANAVDTGAREELAQTEANVSTLDMELGPHKAAADAYHLTQERLDDINRRITEHARKEVDNDKRIEIRRKELRDHLDATRETYRAAAEENKAAGKRIRELAAGISKCRDLIETGKTRAGRQSKGLTHFQSPASLCPLDGKPCTATDREARCDGMDKEIEVLRTQHGDLVARRKELTVEMGTATTGFDARNIDIVRPWTKSSSRLKKFTTRAKDRERWLATRSELTRKHQEAVVALSRASLPDGYEDSQIRRESLLVRAEVLRGRLADEVQAKETARLRRRDVGRRDKKRTVHRSEHKANLQRRETLRAVWWDILTPYAGRLTEEMGRVLVDTQISMRMGGGTTAGWELQTTTVAPGITPREVGNLSYAAQQFALWRVVAGAQAVPFLDLNAIKHSIIDAVLVRLSALYDEKTIAGALCSVPVDYQTPLRWSLMRKGGEVG